jgi:hypothetical protein
MCQPSGRATAQNEVHAQAIADAMQARERWRLDEAERSPVELADPCYDCGALSAGSAGQCYRCPLLLADSTGMRAAEMGRTF